MDDKIKKAWDQIQAEPELKERTKAFLYKKTKGYTGAKTAGYFRLLPIAACVLLLLFGVRWFYFTPTIAISIDVNPSVELGINRFDKIISIRGYNDDGKELADALDIKYLDYKQAVSMILANEDVNALLAEDELMAIGVIGEDDAQSARVLAEIETCTAEQTNTYCYYANFAQVQQAHTLGLSYGKYKAYLELQALDSTISVEQIRGMTMREIRNWIEDLSGEENSGWGEGNGKETGGRGSGNGKGKRSGRGG